MIKSYIPMPLPPKKRTKNKNSVLKRLFYFCVALAVSGSAAAAINCGQIEFENYLYAQISRPIHEIVLATPKPEPKKPELDAKAALLLRLGDDNRQKMLFKKNIDQKLPIASITKLMTAKVILENSDIYELSRMITVSFEAAARPDVPVFGNLQAGEIYSVEQLLSLVLHYSSNDAVQALVEVMGEERFVLLMNESAARTGLDQTMFFNATGLDEQDGRANYSTALDLTALTENILEFHPEIFAITKTPGPYRTQNGVFDFNLWDGQKLVGGKTGYTEKAGGCMIAVFDDESGWRYIGVLLGAVNSETRVAEMQKMINFSGNYN